MALLDLSMSMSKALSVLSRWQYTLSSTPDLNDIEAIQQMVQSARQFEFEYTLARYEIYYKRRKDAATASREDLGLIPDFNSRGTWKVNHELILHMNGFFFLLDSVVRVIIDCEPKLAYSADAAISQIVLARNKAFHLQSLDVNLDGDNRGRVWRQRWAKMVSALRFRWSRVRAVAVDFLPSQRHLFCCQDMRNLSPVIKTRLRQSLSLSIAMSLAGVYGLYANRIDPTFAAFTIANLCGGAVLGASIVTSFNRSVGTVSSCVLSLLVVQIIRGWSEWTSKWFIGVVIVLAQLPATYVRSLPQYGYAGTVFGFSLPVLLLQYSVFNETVAIQRIVDTIVGCVIFVCVELLLLLFYASSEDLLLESTMKLFGGIEGHLSEFSDMFKTSLVGVSSLANDWSDLAADDVPEETEQGSQRQRSAVPKDPKYNPNISNEFNRQKELA
eukprot:gene4633-5882_t